MCDRNRTHAQSLSVGFRLNHLMWRTGILLPLLVALLGVEQGKALSPCKLCQTVLTADVFAPCDAASKQARQDKRDAGECEASKLTCSLAG